VGDCYRLGKGVPRDLEVAAFHYLLAQQTPAPNQSVSRLMEMAYHLASSQLAEETKASICRVVYDELFLKSGADRFLHELSYLLIEMGNLAIKQESKEEKKLSTSPSHSNLADLSELSFRLFLRASGWDDAAAAKQIETMFDRHLIDFDTAIRIAALNLGQAVTTRNVITRFSHSHPLRSLLLVDRLLLCSFLQKAVRK
jgi:hypothetical protein